MIMAQTSFADDRPAILAQICWLAETRYDSVSAHAADGVPRCSGSNGRHNLGTSRVGGLPHRPRGHGLRPRGGMAVDAAAHVGRAEHGALGRRRISLGTGGSAPVLGPAAQ